MNLGKLGASVPALLKTVVQTTNLNEVNDTVIKDGYTPQKRNNTPRFTAHALDFFRFLRAYPQQL
jgi:hypothetical protein